MKTKNLFGLFRKIAFIEGVSFLVLLLIAMPLKYFAGMPLAVTAIGSIHGILFVAFVILAWLVREEFRKSFAWMIKAFLSSLIPFGTFVLDREWRKEEAAAVQR
jgi:integral membrane protein